MTVSGGGFLCYNAAIPYPLREVFGVAASYDLLIVGGGLAGLTAGMYAARYGLHTGLVERLMGGAQIVNVERIENFPGFPEGIAGAELGPAAQEQAMAAGVDFLMDEAVQIVREEGHSYPFRVDAEAGSYRAAAVIIASGSRLRRADIPGEERLWGRGVSQCATCDGPLSMGQVVGVIGGGDAAADEALTLTEYADRVIIFHRREELRAQQILQTRLAANPKVEIRYNTTVTEICGTDTVSGVKAHNAAGQRESIALAAVFVYVGLQPNSELAKGLVDTDRAGHIPVNLRMETATPGLYAAGDVRQHSAAQLVTSAGDGATAALAAFRYLRGR